MERTTTMSRRTESQWQDDIQKLTEFQEMLLDARVNLEKKRKKPIRDYEFAYWLGVSSNTLAGWMVGIRKPSYDNTIRISRRLGTRVFHVLGYTPIVNAYLPELVYIVNHWEKLNRESKEQIIGHIVEETGEPAPNGY
jgi:DNA-binding transcriptional regulator YiaG